MNEAKDKYWFPAKTFGWGWGLPCRWQGWVVMAAYLGLMAAGALCMRPGGYTSHYRDYVVGLSVVLLVICWRKGEKPAWRWGGNKRGE